MTAIVAFGAISALGEGRRAVFDGLATPRLGIERDDALVAAGFERPFVARAPLPVPATEERSTALLLRALVECTKNLDASLAAWRGRRVGLALGTSASRMLADAGLLARVRVAPESRARELAYFAPLAAARELVGVSLSPASLVLTACAASTVAIGLAHRWLAGGACDIVLAGGFDAVDLFVASGFEILRATTKAPPPRPFHVDRDGMSLGEGAAVLALMRDADAPSRPLAYVAGFGVAADAGHLTAPDRAGSGMRRAAERALADAHLSASAVDLVSAHATATPFNDAAEAAALAAVLPLPSSEHEAPVLVAAKAQWGHALGASGALETLGAAFALSEGIAPATPVAGPTLPVTATHATMRTTPERRELHAALKLSAAFGGANAALVLSTGPGDGAAASRGAVLVGAAVHVDAAMAAPALAAELGVPVERVARMDALTRLVVAAAKRLAHIGDGSRVGVVVGHALATLETNALFAARLVERGPRAIEPRRFPYTSPNAAAGECGALFGWSGPGLATGAGLHGPLEALAIAVELVAAGDADAMVVVGVDDLGPTATHWLEAEGLTGTLVMGAAAVVVARDGARLLGRGAWPIQRVETRLAAPTAASGLLGHRALLAFAPGAFEAGGIVSAQCPFGGAARVEVGPALSWQPKG